MEWHQGELFPRVGLAGVDEALVADQSSGWTDQDGWATGSPCQEAGVSACRGAGDRGNADRDTRTDQLASSDAWLGYLGNAGIGEGYGVI